MLTPEDIKNLTNYQLEVFKDVFVTKEDFSHLQKSMEALVTAVDNLANTVKNLQHEYLVNHHKIQRLENWAKMVADKVGIPLPF